MSLTIKQPPTELSSRQARFLQGWAFTQRELVYLCWGLMDVALLTPFALSLMGWARYWPPGLFMLWLLLIMMLAFNLSRLMGALKLSPARQQVVMAVGLLLLVILTLRTLLHTADSLLDMSWVGQFFAAMNERGNLLWQRDVILFGLVVFMWARGIQIAGRGYSVDRIGLRLRVGGLFIAPLVVWIGSRNLLWNPTPFVLLFFLAGITAVALIRAEEVAREETGASASLSPRWLALIFVTACLIIFTAGAITVLVTGEPGDTALGLLSPVWLAMQLLLITVIATIGYLLGPLITVIEALFFLLRNLYLAIASWLSGIYLILSKIFSKLYRTERAPAEITISEQPTGPAQVPSFEDAAEIGYGLGSNGQIIVVLLAIALILLVALLIQRQYRAAAVTAHTTHRARRTAKEEEEDEGLAQRLLRRLGFRRHWRAALSIRRIYRRMMKAAAAVGYPKPDAQTPYEYLPTLNQAWPHNHQDARLITEAYVNVRYGEIPESSQELEEIKQAWQRLEQNKPAKMGQNQTE